MVVLGRPSRTTHSRPPATGRPAGAGGRPSRGPSRRRCGGTSGYGTGDGARIAIRRVDGAADRGIWYRSITCSRMRWGARRAPITSDFCAEHITGIGPPRSGGQGHLISAPFTENCWDRSPPPPRASPRALRVSAVAGLRFADRCDSKMQGTPGSGIRRSWLHSTSCSRIPSSSSLPSLSMRRGLASANSPSTSLAKCSDRPIRISDMTVNAILGSRSAMKRNPRES